MRTARFLAPWKDSHEKPSTYHVIDRIVDPAVRARPGGARTERSEIDCLKAARRGRGGGLDQQFRIFMRMQENFSGCRVLTYCVMSNHFRVMVMDKMRKMGLDRPGKRVRWRNENRKIFGAVEGFA